MDLLDVLFRGIGLFYLAGSYLGLRAVLTDAVVDRALAALSAAPADRTEEWRRRIVGSQMVMTAASGAALALMSGLALPLFIACLAAQAVWIGYGRRFFITPDEDDPKALRSVVNAAALYALVTAGIGWLWADGRLGDWADPLTAALIVGVTAALAGWFVWQFAWKPNIFAPHATAETGPQRIVIDPTRHRWPLVDADTGERFSHLTHLDVEIGWRVEHWDDVFQEGFADDGETETPEFTSPQERTDYLEEGRAIAAALADRFGASNISFGDGWRRIAAPDATDA